MKHQSWFTLYILIFLFQYGCLDNIAFDVPINPSDDIAIFGKIVKSNPSYAEVSIAAINDLTTDGTIPVRIASAIIKNTETGEQLILDKINFFTFNKSFEHSGTFELAYNDYYILEVTLEDGSVITSSSEPLLEVPEVENLTFDISEKYVDFYISFPLLQTIEGASNIRILNQNSFRLTDLKDSICYVTIDLQIDSIQTIIGDDLNTDRLENYKVYRKKISQEMAEGYYYSVFLESLSPGAQEYWSRLNGLLNKSGNMFDIPPGVLSSNFSAEWTAKERNVNGYFYVTERDTARIYISPEVAGNPRQQCDFIVPPIEIPSSCEDCLVKAENSSYLKPSFWK